MAMFCRSRDQSVKVEKLSRASKKVTYELDAIRMIKAARKAKAVDERSQSQRALH
jgi:hypothetical protein